MIDQQQQMEQIEENEDEEYEYDNNNTEDICDEEIYYDEYIYQ